MAAPRGWRTPAACARRSPHYHLVGSAFRAGLPAWPTPAALAMAAVLRFAPNAAPEHLLRLFWAAAQPGARAVTWKPVASEGALPSRPHSPPARSAADPVDRLPLPAAEPAPELTLHGQARPLVLEANGVALFKANAAAQYVASLAAWPQSTRPYLSPPPHAGRCRRQVHSGREQHAGRPGGHQHLAGAGGRRHCRLPSPPQRDAVRAAGRRERQGPWPLRARRTGRTTAVADLRLRALPCACRCDRARTWRTARRGRLCAPCGCGTLRPTSTWPSRRGRCWTGSSALTPCRPCRPPPRRLTPLRGQPSRCGAATHRCQRGASAR